MADDEQTKRSPENTPPKSKVKPRNRKRPPHGGKFSIKNAHTSERQIIRKRRIATALDLRLQGHSLDEIARHLKTGRTSVHNWISGALEDMIVEPAQQLLKMELRRLDELQSAIYTEAATGHLPSLYSYLAIHDRRCRLLGLTPRDGSPSPLALQINNGGGPQPLEVTFITPTRRELPDDERPPGYTADAKPDYSKPALPKPTERRFSMWPSKGDGRSGWMK
jgi:hypothetical protein